MLYRNWINKPFNCDHIANIIIGEGYIPYAPFGGLHIMDDFGNLIESLPQNRFDYMPRGLEWRIFWNYDTQYMYH